jgi:hypothetical protein
MLQFRDYGTNLAKVVGLISLLFSGKLTSTFFVFLKCLSGIEVEAMTRS